jgi:TM2 domain-containing membrane protein YozV
MNCDYHPGMGAIAKCDICGKNLCSICHVKLEDKSYCRPCVIEAMSKKPVEEQKVEAAAPEKAPETPAIQKEAPAPATPAIEEQAKPEAPEKIQEPVQAPVPVPAKMPAVQQAPEAAKPPVRVKEPLLSLILSILIPGLGQIYNGHIKKGIIFIVLYLLVIGGSVPILWGSVGACCCFPLIFAIIIVAYSAYEAYITADKMNKGEKIPDWF